MIVLNENEWVENVLKERSIGRKPSETLCRVAKYYIWKCGYSKKDTKKLLSGFVLQCMPTASMPKWSDTIDFVISVASKKKPIEIDGVYITKGELDAIEKVDGRQAQRLAFTLLCLSKYWDTVNETDSHWVNTKDSDIMKLANINTSSKRQGTLYHQLNELGMVQFSKKVDNTNVKVLFAEDGESETVITDFRNLGYQYMRMQGEPYFVCKNCGITTRIRNPEGVGRKQIYCTDCANKVKVQQMINAVMKKRASNNGSGTVKKNDSQKSVDNQQLFGGLMGCYI